MTSFSRESSEGTFLEVYVQPKAAKNEIVGIHEGSLKIRLTAPPVEGAANKGCVEFLAKWLDVSKTCIEITHGHRSRRKTVLIRGVPFQRLCNVFKEEGLLP